MQQGRTILLIVAVTLLSGVAVAAAPQEGLEATVRLLNERVAAQDKRIAELEAKQKGDLTAEEKRNFLQLYKELQSDAKKRSNDLRLYWKDGIRMDTRDGKFKLKFGGRLMADWGWIDGGGLESDLGTDLEDGTEFRRARLYVQGDIYKDLEFKLQFDFAGGDADMKDAYLKFKNIPIIGNITVGHFKEPFSLEELTSSKYITFLERALPNAFAPGRNMGIKANNTLFDERVTWAIGLFRANSNDFGEDDVDGESALTGRVTWLPWYEENGRKLVHLGAAYSFRSVEDPIRFRQRPEAHFIPQYFTDTGSFSAEHVNLFGAEAALVYGPFSLQGEYISAAVDSSEAGNPCLNGFYVQGSYFLTGEHRKYKRSAGAFSRVKPKKNFREDGGLGAWEIACRYSYLDLGEGPFPDTARRMQNATIGLNWHLNPNVRIMWNYIRSSVAGADTSDAADIFMTRVQVDF